MPELGETFAHYRIDAILGKGGMGQVYLAFDEKLHRQVALKVLLKAEAEDAQRMVREARAAAAVEHPNKVTIYELGEAEGLPYIAMELIRGPTLRALVDDPETTWQRAVSLLIDVARALEAAHAAGLVHRDVKPENVMVRDDGVVKVLDFGIARRSATAMDPSAPTATATGGLVMGSPAYMAPEQILGDPIDGRCDEFAWAVMAFELFTGEHPWGTGGDAMKIMSTMLTKPPRRVADLRPDLPPDLSVIVARALSHDRGDRFPSMKSVVDELTPLLGESGRQIVAPIAPAPAPILRANESSEIAFAPTTAADSRAVLRAVAGAPRRRWWIGAVVAVVACGVAAVVLVSARRGPAAASDAPLSSGFDVAASSAASPKPAPRYRCHADLQERGAVACGASSVQWCDTEGRKIACCAEGLVAAGRDGMCVCPPLTSPASRARGCRDAPGAKGFEPGEAKDRLSDGRARVSRCFTDDAREGRTLRLGFLIDFSPEGDTAAVKILRSDSPDPERQACALRELRTLRGWASPGGATSWEMEWDVGAPPPALAKIIAEDGKDKGYGYEFSTRAVKLPAPPLNPVKPMAPPPGKLPRTPPEAIENVIIQAFPKLDACYQAGLTASPKLSGAMVSSFVVAGDGRIVQQNLDGSSLGDAAVVTCVSSTIAGLQFPTSQAGIVTVVYPMAFGGDDTEW